MPTRQQAILASVGLASIVALALAFWIDPFHLREPKPIKLAPEEIAALHNRLLTIDTHVDIPGNWASDEMDAGSNDRAQVDLNKMRIGGLDAAFFIVYVPQGPRDTAGNSSAVAQAFEKFAAIHRMTDNRNTEQISLAYSADDVERLNQDSKLVALIGVENGYALGHHLELLSIYYDLGARYLGFAYNGVNDLADGAMQDGSPEPVEPEHNGISTFGRAVIAECNRLGIMVDVSHSSKQATMQAAGLSRAPIIASHSAISSVYEHLRNLDSEELRAIADTGGVVQVVAYDTFLKEAPEKKLEAIRALSQEFGLGPGRGPLNLPEADWKRYQERRAEIDRKWPRAGLKELANHIDAAVKEIGVDHVGISSDFGGGGGIDGWSNAAETQAVTAELVARGYSDDDLAKLWGGNILRVMREVEAVAREEQSAAQ